MAAVDAVNVKSVKYPPSLFDLEGWKTKKKILVILAHPDDPEFFCGATISKWAQAGHEISYCLLTKGQKGSQDPNITADEISAIRVVEQKKAAETLGVRSVEFMDYVDGEVVPDLEMQKKIVRAIRKHTPQIVVTSDPQNLFPSDKRINHPDHRAAGQAVIDALFPAAGNPMFFPELLHEEKLNPVNVEEIWISATAQPSLIMDMTDYFDAKMAGILCHASQIGSDVALFKQMMRSRFITDPESGKLIYPEQFKRIVF